MASPMLNKLSNLLAEAQQQADLVAASLTRSEVEHREAVERAWKANHNTQAELLSIKASRDSLVCSLKDMTKQRDAALAELGAVKGQRDALRCKLNPPSAVFADRSPVYAVHVEEHAIRYGHVCDVIYRGACHGVALDYVVRHQHGSASFNTRYPATQVFATIKEAGEYLANHGKNL